MVIAQDRHFASVFSFDDPNAALRAFGGEDRKHRIIGAESSLIEIDFVIRSQHNNPLPEGWSGHIPQLDKSRSRLVKDGCEPPVRAEQRLAFVFVRDRK